VKAAQVLLGGGDLPVTAAVHDDPEFGATGEPSRGVRIISEHPCC